MQKINIIPADLFMASVLHSLPRPEASGFGAIRSSFYY